MGLSRKNKHDKVAPEMNVTPLVDVVLVLLIIFMVILPAVNSENNIELATIQTPDKGEHKDEEPFLLSIDATGTYFLDGYALKADDLVQHLKNAHVAEPDKKLALRGDRRMTYVKARELMKVIQDVGFPGISLRVMKQPSVDGDLGGDKNSELGATASLAP